MESLTLVELKDIARAKKLKGWSKMNKQSLLQFLQSSSPKPRARSPSPRKRSPSPRKRSPSPRKRSPSPRKRSPSPRKRSPSPRKRSPSPRKRSPSPRARSPSPRKRSPSPKPRTRSPKHKTFNQQKCDREKKIDIQAMAIKKGIPLQTPDRQLKTKDQLCLDLSASRADQNLSAARAFNPPKSAVPPSAVPKYIADLEASKMQIEGGIEEVIEVWPSTSPLTEETPQVGTFTDVNPRPINVQDIEMALHEITGGPSSQDLANLTQVKKTIYQSLGLIN